MSILTTHMPGHSVPTAGRTPMRILLLPSSYAPVLGGLQTVAGALAGQLRGLGHDVRVVTNRYPRSLPAHETVDGVPVERWQFLSPSWRQLRRGRPDLFLASLYYSPRVQLRLGRLLRSFRPEVVNVHFPDAQAPFVLRQRQRFDFRLVVSLHGHDVERFTAGPDQPASRSLRSLLREADAVTACSGHLLEEACALESSVATKGTAVYNGIDPTRFRDEASHPHPRPYILALGRLTAKKGFDLLIEALARVGGAAGAVDLILAGEGEERAALQTLARRLGLGERVHFHGRASQKEVIRLLNGCRFLAVPSRVEPFGIVALEGLAAGKPVLATGVGGMDEFLTNFLASAMPEGKQSPVVFTKPDTETMAEGLRACLGMTWSAAEQQALAAAARRHYSWGQVTRRYEGILRG